ncbi:MAG: hypothetical protein M3326_00940 [Actinomycetota bacterium]|nr:hypothetical protein [Actinomycetota bacterium]
MAASADADGGGMIAGDGGRFAQELEGAQMELAGGGLPLLNPRAMRAGQKLAAGHIRRRLRGSSRIDRQTGVQRRPRRLQELACPFDIDRRVVGQVQEVGPEGVAEHLGAGQADRRQRAPQPEHHPAEGRRPRLRKILPAPQRLGQLIARHWPVTMEDEDRKGHPPQRPGDRLGELRGSDLDRHPPEKGDVHLSRHRLTLRAVTPTLRGLW